MTKKALMSLARSLNAIDLTYDHEVRKGCECLTEVAYSAGVYGCNGCILCRYLLDCKKVVENNFRFKYKLLVF